MSSQTPQLSMYANPPSTPAQSSGLASSSQDHIKKAQKELGLDRLIYGYTYIAEKGNDYQNQLEWTTFSKLLNTKQLLNTELEWLGTIIETIEIENEKSKQKYASESSGNYIYCTAFYLDPKTSGKIFIYQNVPIKKIN